MSQITREVKRLQQERNVGLVPDHPGLNSILPTLHRHPALYLEKHGAICTHRWQGKGNGLVLDGSCRCIGEKKDIPVLSLQKEPPKESFQRWKVVRGRQSVIPALLHAS